MEDTMMHTGDYAGAPPPPPPNMAVTEGSSNEHKRKRLTQACDMCRKKKIKCDGGRPSCKNCVKLNRECTYIPSTKKRGPRQGYIEMLEKRLDKMEKILYPGGKDEKVALSPTSSTSDDRRTTMTTSTASDSVRPEFAASSAPSHPTASPIKMEASPIPNDQQVLPPGDVIEHLVTLFFDNVYTTIPVLDPRTFMQDVRQGKCSEFLLLSVMSVAARFSSRPDIKETPAWHAGEKYAKKARDLHVVKAIDDPSLANVQALLLLTLHEFGCARGPRSWMYSGMAIRMALELGLNKEEEAEDGFTQPQPAEKWLQQEYRRRTFWSIFVLDRIQSAATGRPMFLQDEDCDLFLPSDEDGWTRGHFYTETIDKSRVAYFNIQDLQESNLLRVTATISAPTNVANADQKPELSCHAYMLHAIVLLGKLTMFINRGKITKSSLPPYHPESEFAQLDRQIDEWSDRLPPHLQNTAANLHKFRTNSSIDGGRFVMAHILHNALTVLLHRPSLVMADTLNSEMIQPALRNFINDSVKKCTKAVDAVTDMLRAINNCTSLMPPYLTYLSYTVATIAVNNTFSPNPEEANKAREALTVHFQLLQSMRIYWAMADKLYFMIRDLYAMHSNMQRVQANRNESSTSPSSFSSAREMPMNFPPPPPPATMPPSQVPPRFNSMAPNASLFSAPQTMTPSPIPPTLMRKMSLADVSASTCDGVSCTDWILGDNSENIAAALQSIVRSPGIGITGNNFFDLQMTNDMEAAGQLTGNELGWMYQFPANYSSGNQ